jgi:nucleolin
MSETPRGRPPKTKSVLYKIRDKERDTNKDDIQVPVKEEVPASQSVEEPKYDPIPEEKKPRTEKQINAFHKMMEARKQKITINSQRNEKSLKPEIKEVIRNEKQEPDMMKMMNELHERMNQMQTKKQKTIKPVKEKKSPVVLEKPEPKPKPKKRVMKEETSEEEESEEESEDEDDAYVKKYTQKAEKRFNAVKQIEQRLQQVHKPKGKYDHLSIF